MTPESEAGRNLLIVKRAHHFACFYRDIRKAFRNRKLRLHGSVSVRRTGVYGVHKDHPFALITTPPAIAPGSKPFLYVRLK